MGFKKLAKDSEGNTYVAERTVDGDAVLRVVVNTIQSAKHGDITYWPYAEYEVVVGDSDPVRIIRRGNGLYDVPDKAKGIPMSDAVRIALGRMQPPAPSAHRARVRPVRAGRSSRSGRQDHNLSTSPTAQPGPQVIEEPQENWTLQQGDRIMRHLANYPEGVDPQTMSAGMHDVPTNKIRAHLRRLMKNGGPVTSPRTGIYKRREA